MADTYQKQSVSTDLARRMITAAEEKARELGVPMNIAVVDESGVLKAFSRMDGAALVSVQIAQDKAYTAVGFGMPTHGWHEFIKDDPPLATGATAGIDRLIFRRRLSDQGRRRGRRRDRRQRRPLHPGHGGGQRRAVGRSRGVARDGPPWLKTALRP